VPVVRRYIITVRANRLPSPSTRPDHHDENILRKEDDEYGAKKKRETSRKLTGGQGDLLFILALAYSLRLSIK
jgi:hypothetical protein